MNSVTLAGNLGNDAEQKTIPSGESVTTFRLACKGHKKDAVVWYRVTVWGKMGTAIAQYLTKGKTVAVRGELTEARTYESGGETRISIEVRADAITLLGGGEKSDAKPSGKSSAREEDLPF